MVLLGLAAMAIAGIAIAIFDPESLSGPDADQQEKVLLTCLRDANFTVKSEIPPLGPVGDRNPEYEVEVRSNGDAVAFVYLFDLPERAELFVDEAKLDAETEDEKATVKQRGPAAVDLIRGASTTPAIHRCMDRAAEPPAEEK